MDVFCASAHADWVILAGRAHELFTKPLPAPSAKRTVPSVPLVPTHWQNAPIIHNVCADAQTPRRKDAVRNRSAILSAASELFSSGRVVPMYEIGRHAGVGQATLYRHFPDRAAIVAAIAREHVERIEATTREHHDDDHAILIVLRAAADMLVCIHDLVGILSDDTVGAPILGELRRRMDTVLATTLERSRDSHVLRDDIRTEDLRLVLNMINGGLAGVPTIDERAATATRALEVALRGLQHRP